MNYLAKLSNESEKVISALQLLALQLVQDSCLKAARGQYESITSEKYRRSIANRFFIDHSGISETVEEVQNFIINSVYDDFKIPVRLYKPNNSTKKLIMFAHGGGWIQGNLETHDYLCRKIANSLNADVLAVDYRLAPENIFPIPLNDVSSVYLWCSKLKNYEEISLCGDSAGGNLCAALCIKLHGERHDRKPSSQILIYPVLENNFQSKSFKKFKYLATLSQLSMIYFTSQYTGENYDFSSVLDNKLISPVLEEDMSVFPRTFVVSAGCDVLLDGQSEFKNKMVQANVNCPQIICDGAVHGFMTYGKEFDKDNTDVLKQVSEWFDL